MKTVLNQTDKYDGNDNYGKPKSDYLAMLSAKDNAKLFDETKLKIWLSAYASNNRRSDYHWQCDACYDECVKRGKVAMYEKAHRENFGD